MLSAAVDILEKSSPKVSSLYFLPVLILKSCSSEFLSAFQTIFIYVYKHEISVMKIWK